MPQDLHNLTPSRKTLKRDSFKLFCCREICDRCKCEKREVVTIPGVNKWTPCLGYDERELVCFKVCGSENKEQERKSKSLLRKASQACGIGNGQPPLAQGKLWKPFSIRSRPMDDLTDRNTATPLPPISSSRKGLTTPSDGAQIDGPSSGRFPPSDGQVLGGGDESWGTIDKHCVAPPFYSRV